MPEIPLLRKSQPLPAEQSPYRRFCLTDNPFPSSPTITPESSDPRVNGDIYCEDLRLEAQARFERLLIPGKDGVTPRSLALLMDYATRRGRGIGKTAFLNHQRRRIMADLGYQLTGGAYVVMGALVIPEAGGRTRKFWQFIRLIAQALNSGNCIATAIWRLRAFSDVIPSNVLERIEPNSLAGTLGDDRWLREQGIAVEFELYRAVEAQLVRAGVRQDIASVLAQRGHDPKALEQYFFRLSDHRWRTDGPALVFNDLVCLFRAADVNRIVLLVDEVEKIVVPQNSIERRAFVDDLRRFFIDGPYESVFTRMYGLLLTIHPYIQEIWQPHWKAAGLDRVCPIGGSAAQEFTVYFYPLKADEAAVQLVQTYLDYFRDDPGERGSLHPFDKDAVITAMDLEDGLPGPMLTLLRLALEKAITDDWTNIDSERIRAIYEMKAPDEPVEELGGSVLPAPQVNLLED